MVKDVFFSIDFTGPPDIGTALMQGAQRYELIRIQPYVRQDGKQSWILHWQSHCPECGAVFTATSGLKGQSLNRRCPKHHKAGRAVSARPKTFKKFKRKTTRKGEGMNAL